MNEIMRSSIIALIMCILILILLTGCSSPKCIESHEVKNTCVYMYCTTFNNIRTCTPIPYTCNITICDKYEEGSEK